MHNNKNKVNYFLAGKIMIVGYVCTVKCQLKSLSLPLRRKNLRSLTFRIKRATLNNTCATT